MGGNAIKTSRPVTFDEAQETVKWLKENVLRHLLIREQDIELLGSYGKKKDGEIYGDIDIAVLLKPDPNSFPKNTELNMLQHQLETLGFDSAINYGFRIVSFGCPIAGNHEMGIVQVDFMITHNLEWSEFIYHSPDFRKGESEYKGFYRNILLMAIITESKKEIIKFTDIGGIEEIEVNILKFPWGVWRVRKNFMGKKGKLVKGGTNVNGSEYFVTDQPMEILDLTVGSQFIPSDIDTFEKLWHIVMSPNFKWINKRADIINRFIECIEEQNLPLPNEVLKKCDIKNSNL
jgi:hypothetical protein